MYASHNGHTSTVKLLLEAGANKEAKDKVSDGVCKRMNRSHTLPHVVDMMVWEGKTTASSQRWCWLSQYMCAPSLLHFFILFYFPIWESAPQGVSNAIEDILSSFLARHFISGLIVRAIWRAVTAREYFEKWEETMEISIFVESALLSLLVWIVSDANTETCLEIAKVMFRRESGFRILIWAREHIRFQIQVWDLCVLVPLRAFTLVNLYPSHTHMNLPSAFHLTFFFSSFSSHLPLFCFCFFSCALSVVCVPLSIAWWQHSAHLGLVQRSHVNCEALVGSGGKQGGQG